MLQCCDLQTYVRTVLLTMIPVTSKQVLQTTRSDYIDVKIINLQRPETTTQIPWLLLHNEHETSIFMIKSHSDNHGQKSWDTLVFPYTEVHKGNKTPHCPPSPPPTQTMLTPSSQNGPCRFQHWLGEVGGRGA